MAAAPRRHLMRMSAAGAVTAWPLVVGAATVLAGSATGMNSAPAVWALRTSLAELSTCAPHPRRHLCTSLAFSPCEERVNDFAAPGVMNLRCRVRVFLG